MARPAVFLDRDGTIIDDVGYLSRCDQIKLRPGAANAIRKWNEAGWPVILITNQSGVARGYFDEASIGVVHEHLQKMLAEQSARLDAIYYCPHHPDGIIEKFRQHCDCRKPRPGMLLQAAREYDLDLSKSIMMGDKQDDVDAGSSAGCKSLRVDREDFFTQFEDR